MKIYTKTGDQGTTSLVGGQRAMKNDIKLEAYGTIDELNSFLGLLRAKTKDKETCALLLDIQNTLFVIGANLATDKTTTKLSEYAVLSEEKVENIEKTIDKIQETLPKLTNFIIYGEDELSAICHVCRAISRRAERQIVTVNQTNTVDDSILRYMNRLSDLLFVLARDYTKCDNKSDFYWEK